MFPPLPPFTGLHPLVIHFPIALLLVAPLLVLMSIVWSRARTEFAVAALLLMLIGTAGAVVAVSSGKAAGELAERTSAVAPTLERHQDLAETTRNSFMLLTAAFSVIVAVPVVRRRTWSRAAYGTIAAVFLVFYAGGALALVNTAHQGGRLVHEHGIRAMIGSSPGATATPAQDDDDRH